MSGKSNEIYSEALHYAHISYSNFEAAYAIWRNLETDGDDSRKKTVVVVHPLSQLLGLALEICLKGLLVARGNKPPHVHDLEKLFGSLNDTHLEQQISQSLRCLKLPEDLLVTNGHTDPVELEAMYRRHHIHIASLNSVYNATFISRYPSAKSFMMPNVEALIKIIKTTQSALNDETRL